MRRYAIFGIIAIVLAGCAGMSAQLIPGVSLNAPSLGGAAASAAAGPVDFRSGEVLAAVGDNQDAFRDQFHLATIVTPATPATKNQAEALYIADGKKEWVKRIVASRKVAKTDLAVGKTILVPTGWQNHKELDAEQYRKAAWHLARVTSVDEMFKDLVEAGGEKFYWQLVRMPDQEVK